MDQSRGLHVLDRAFPGLFAPEEAAVYETVLQKMGEMKIGFAMGGGLAFSHYSQRRRNTQDIDLYVLPSSRQVMADILTSAGFEDYHDRAPYDRGWIYRGFRNGLIVDVIWGLANYKAQVDPLWLERAPQLREGLHVLPVEELIWAKLFVLQRDRCDWPDLLSVLYRQVGRLDWDHLLHRVKGDERLLGSLVALFGWLCPEEAAQVPDTVWPRLGLVRPVPGAGAGVRPRRVPLLDTRDWFGPDEQAGTLL